jgi:hypothetical protein
MLLSGCGASVGVGDASERQENRSPDGIENPSFQSCCLRLYAHVMLHCVTAVVVLTSIIGINDRCHSIFSC